MATEEIDLYEVLKIERGASKDDIRKSYRKLALLHHPDKVAEADRESADVEFKKISSAYEILYDDEKREMYDQFGMSAFDGNRGMGGAPPDMEEMLAQMFGMGMGGMPGMGGMGGGPGVPRPRKGRDDVQEYEVTLEELYKGKTVKFASTKNIICSHCKGSGGKEGAKSRQCSGCGGKGVKSALKQQGPFLTEQLVECESCHGTGNVFYDKDKCKKCKGKRTVSEKKFLELYIPPGAMEGERIRLHGEADQVPDQEPGDIVFVLKEKDHEVFTRSGHNLAANVTVTLAEALCGLSRVVIKTLDDRGLHINHQKPQGGVLKPGEVLKISGEGMPIKKGESKGDLFLMIEVEFPDDKLLQDQNLTSTLEKILPKFQSPIQTDEVDEVEYTASASIDEFEAGGGGDEDWEDDEDEGAGAAQCAQQ